MTEGTVAVEFIDAETGQAFARSDLPASQLPASFAAQTTLHLGGDQWQVERAEPTTAAEFVPAGRLVLTLRRVSVVAARDVKFSLPTICDVVPSVVPAGSDVEALELHEDDWRQIELVSRSLIDAVATELQAIRAIYDSHGVRDGQGNVFAFERIHVRSLVPLAEPLSWRALRDVLPAPEHRRPVTFRGSTGAIAAGSFALGFGSHSWYGIVDGDDVSVVGLRLERGPISLTSIEPVLRAFDVVLVDWCRCAVVDPSNLVDYARAVGGD
jgi:hypothetical protein